MSDSQDIKSQLQGLLAKRDAINGAVESLRKMAEVFNVDISDLDLDAQGDSAPLKPGEAKPPGQKKALPHTAFLGKGMPDAIQQLLNTVGTDLTAAEIRDQLLAGGFKSTGDVNKVYGNVFTTLKRLLERDLIWKREDNGKWGLAEWYPNRKKPGKVVAPVSYPPATGNLKKGLQKTLSEAKTSDP